MVPGEMSRHHQGLQSTSRRAIVPLLEQPTGIVNIANLEMANSREHVRDLGHVKVQCASPVTGFYAVDHQIERELIGPFKERSSLVRLCVREVKASLQVWIELGSHVPMSTDEAQTIQLGLRGEGSEGVAEHHREKLRRQFLNRT